MVVGSSGTASITFASEGATVSGLQCDLAHDKSVQIAATLGSAGVLAGKSLQTALLSNGDLRLMVAGFDQGIIPDGGVITLKIQLSASAAIGTHSLTCKNVVAIVPSGTKIAVSLQQGSVVVVPKS
jgi:hypothetical protein